MSFLIFTRANNPIQIILLTKRKRIIKSRLRKETSVFKESKLGRVETTAGKNPIIIPAVRRIRYSVKTIL